jgi:hypothetical protein
MALAVGLVVAVLEAVAAVLLLRVRAIVVVLLIIHLRVTVEQAVEEQEQLVAQAVQPEAVTVGLA